MDVASNSVAGSSPVIGLGTAFGEAQSLDVVRIRLTVLKLTYQHCCPYPGALTTYT